MDPRRQDHTPRNSTASPASVHSSEDPGMVDSAGSEAGDSSAESIESTGCALASSSCSRSSTPSASASSTTCSLCGSHTSDVDSGKLVPVPVPAIATTPSSTPSRTYGLSKTHPGSRLVDWRTGRPEEHVRFLEGRIALQNRVTEIRPAIPLRESDRHGENNSPKGLGYSLVPVPLTPSSWRWWGDGIEAAEVPDPVVPPRDRWAGVNK